MAQLSEGDVPVVTCTEEGAGVLEAHDVPAHHVYRDALTIAYNGTPLTTKMHPYRFAAKDDVAVAVPKADHSPEVLLFVQMMLNSERWRFSYYRKCFHAKLVRTSVPLPVRSDGQLDTGFMQSFVRSRPHWWFLARRLSAWKPTLPPPAAEDADGDGAGDAA